ncbi:Phthiocerol/phthiodiolone dimycocerosyl transferase C-terminus [Amycolatopsis rubida]|uniref:Phthiocerol/phthiodiolone dimycocerosyl transferase n=2 Tax=Amycolatopsis rubida TaxID=112413 RepID=A0A1I5V4X4_9PSEU|nr:Phthiocerol/phthiodiolone dimycocerosyl transferase C-terminus [Amycolatopsis rubida]
MLFRSYVDATTTSTCERDMNHERRLDPREVNLRHLEPACAVEYEGELDTRLLRQAFRILSGRYLVLRSCIRDDGHAHAMHVPAGHYPSLVTLTGSRDDLLAMVRYPNRIEHGTSRLIAAARPGAESTGWIALQVNHAVMDGRTVQKFLAELWEIYSALAEGRHVQPGPGTGLPRAPSEFLASHHAIVNDLLNGAPNPFTAPEAHPEVGDFPREKWLMLTEEETGQLVAASRIFGTSVHALVCGAILGSTRRRIPIPGLAPMTCSSIVDLRTRANPPLDPVDTANFSLWTDVAVGVAPDDDPVAVGKSMKKTLQSARAKPRHGDAVAHTGRDTAFGRYAHLLTVAITNPGVIPPYATPPGLSFVRLQWLNSVANQFPVKSPHAVYAAYTFNGCITVNGIFPRELFSGEDIESIDNDLRTNLRRMCQSGRDITESTNRDFTTQL